MGRTLFDKSTPDVIHCCTPRPMLHTTAVT